MLITNNKFTEILSLIRISGSMDFCFVENHIAFRSTRTFACSDLLNSYSNSSTSFVSLERVNFHFTYTHTAVCSFVSLHHNIVHFDSVCSERELFGTNRAQKPTYQHNGLSSTPFIPIQSLKSEIYS